MEFSPDISMWKIRHGSHALNCVMAHLGENCFELRLFRDRRLLLTEDFEETEPLFERAEHLRNQIEVSLRAHRARRRAARSPA